MKEEEPESPPPPRKRFGWLRREGIDLGEAAVQFLAVLIGVLLALLINNWNTQRHRQATVHKTMHAIRAELVSNRTALRKNAASYYKVARELRHATANHNQPPRPCYYLNGWHIPGPAGITDSAYQTAIATQALAHMPFKQAHLVAQVYAHQRLYNTTFRFFKEHFMYAGPLPFDLCVDILISAGRQDQGLARSYTPLIGPIKAKWPTQPPKRLPQMGPSKGDSQ